MKYKIIGIILGIVLGTPIVTLGSSFTISLIQGKTPSEAVGILGEQIDVLFGRVSTLETDQANTNLEIEKLKLENENLRLKTEQVSTQTEQIRTKEDRKSRCASLASQIDAKEKVVKQPFEIKIQELNDELRQLKTSELNGGFSPEEFKARQEKINSLRKQIDSISLEMEGALEVLQATPEMQGLLNELNNVLLCA